MLLFCRNDIVVAVVVKMLKNIAFLLAFERIQQDPMAATIEAQGALKR